MINRDIELECALRAAGRRFKDGKSIDIAALSLSAVATDMCHAHGSDSGSPGGCQAG